MLDTWAPLPENSSLTAQLIRHPTASPYAVAKATATDGVDLTAFVENINMRDGEVQVRLKWHMELYIPGSQPKTDEVMEVRLNGTLLWIGIVQNISDYGEQRGERRMTVTCRSRDTTPKWREAKISTKMYSIGTDLVTIVHDILDFVGIELDERILPPSLGVFTVHTSTQMADMTPWDMLTTLLLPAGYEPFVDALGRFKLIPRSVDGVPTRQIGATRLLSVNGSKSVAALTEMRIKWLDPQLTRTENQEQVLGTATITAGFFQMKQEQEVWFSDDRTQRALFTRMVIKQSCNNGLLPVADEEYEQISELMGRITLTTQAWVPILATASLAALLTASKLPDIAPTTGGPTIPTGKIVHGVAEAFLLITMMSIGTGVYEVWGVPYDYVHATNQTTAFMDNAPEWAEKTEEIENDFVMNEEHAQAFAVRELKYAALSANAHNISVVDDPSIERGDVVELPDGSRFYVTGAQREVARGKSHVLQLDGFRV